MTIDYQVQLQGTIVACNILEDGKFFVTLAASSPFDIGELEQRVEFIHELEPTNPYDEIEVYSDRFISHRDRVIDGCCFTFESNRIPTLMGSFREMNYNDEAIGKPARVLGKLEKMKGGNVVLYFHLVDDGVARPRTQFQIEEEEGYAGLVDETF